MKIPLRYQMTEYDCGPTALGNALSFLYDTQELPPDFVKTIYQYTLDDYSPQGVPYRRGSSDFCLPYIGDWFNNYSRRVGFPIRCEFYGREKVSFSEESPLVQGLRQGACAVVKCLYGCEHFVTITGIEDGWVKVFDPYFDDMDDQTLLKEYACKGIKVVHDRPMEMNRLVPVSAMDCGSGSGHTYCMQVCEKRVALLFFKTQEWATVPLSIHQAPDSRPGCL